MTRIQLVFVDSPTPITRSFGFSLLPNCSLCSMKIADRIFFFVSKSKSQEAFLSLILLTVVGMSVLTEGLGLSNTLGAFLAGVLLSETKYRYQIESDIVPFRGLLLGLFFITVGFSIDCSLLIREWQKIASFVFALLATKAAIITGLCRGPFQMSLSQGLQAGLLLSQGGEFAFVCFQLAQSLHILDPATAKLLLTSTAVTMAFTPMLADLGAKVSDRLEKKSGFSHYVGDDVEAKELKKEEGLVVVCGYGRIGRVVCEVLDRKFIRYIVFEADPAKAIEARNRGLPVFFGDVSRPEVLQNFKVGSARMVVTCIADKKTTNKVVVNLKRLYPGLNIIARANDREHQQRLEKTLGVTSVMPVIADDSLLLNLPFGGAVLQTLGYQSIEVESIMDEVRRERVEKNADEKMEVEVVGKREEGEKLDPFTEALKKGEEKKALKKVGDSADVSAGTDEGSQAGVDKVEKALVEALAAKSGEAKGDPPKEEPKGDADTSAKDF